MKEERGEGKGTGNITFRLAQIMDIHKIVYMWIKMREEFSDPVYSILDRDHKEAEIFYISLVDKLYSPQLKDTNIILLALYKTEPIGFGMGTIRILENSSHWLGYCREGEIYVKEKFRNRGIEGDIRLRIVKELNERKVSKVLYEVDYNEKIVKTYKDKGLTPIKIIFMRDEK